MDIPTDQQLVERIEAFLDRHRMAPTRFGREATGEPQLISSIKDGRSPSLKTAQRIASFMADFEARLSAANDAESSGKVADLTAATTAARSVA